MINAMKIREDFPILRRKVNKRQLAYLDNAATTQKPKQVIDKITDYYMNYNANIHRGIHKLSEEATEAYEGSRGKTAKFVNAQSREIVFTKNTTESLNILAYWAFRTLEKGVKLNIAGIRKDGSLDIKNLQSLVTKKTKIVSIAHSSNVLGTINPVKEIGRIAHDAGAICVIDGAQSVPHMPVDMKTLDCDFLAFSSHKMLGPTGIGVLYGKEDMLKSVTPFLRGGDMIKEVFQQTASWNDIPWKFEAGTPNIADVIGFGAAVDYLNKIGMKEVRKHEEELTKYAIKKMSPISGVTIHGLAAERGGAVSFSIDGVHPHDIATILDGEGIAIRSGHMCAQPLMAHLNVPALAMASFYVYNMKEEIDRLIVGIEKVKKIFKTGR